EKLGREIEKLQEDQETYSRKQRNLDRSADDIKIQLNKLKENILKNFAEWRSKLEEDEASTLRVIDEEGLYTLTQIRSHSGALNKMIELVASVNGKTQSLVTETRTVIEPNVPEVTLNLSGIFQHLQDKLNSWENYHSDILGIIMPSSIRDTGLLNVTPSQHNSSGAAPVPTKVSSPLTTIDKEAEKSLESASTPEHSDAVSKTPSQESVSEAATDQEKILQPSSGIDGTTEISQRKSPLSLDPKTANCNLILSDDLRSVMWTDQQQPYSPHPKRFKYLPQVLCSQSFSSGSHSWDVATDGNYWRIGIVYGSYNEVYRTDVCENAKDLKEVSTQKMRGVEAEAHCQDRIQSYTDPDELPEYGKAESYAGQESKIMQGGQMSEENI
ncbi:hypothetical protein chiPu_0020297, partial [Chiloscyllium punctatum]|nr:hypothetical protein [Chiloscyllium punctatum]